MTDHDDPLDVDDVVAALHGLGDALPTGAMRELDEVRARGRSRQRRDRAVVGAGALALVAVVAVGAQSVLSTPRVDVAGTEAGDDAPADDGTGSGTDEASAAPTPLADDATALLQDRLDTMAPDPVLVSFTTLGDATVGDTPTEAATALGVTLLADDLYDQLRAEHQCGDIGIAEEGWEGILLTVTGPDPGIVTGFTVVDGLWSTDRGIRIGDPADLVMTAYGPDATRTTGNAASGNPQIVVTGEGRLDGSAIVFDLDEDDTVIAYAAGADETVLLPEGCV